VTPAQVWVHFAHRVGAVLVVIALGVLAHRVARGHVGQKLLMRPTWVLTVLLFAQIALGVMVVVMRKPADITSSHVAVGALILLTAFVVGVRAWRLGAVSHGSAVGF
jgi:cytochrome c oxidase assembly protein subunit 15